MFSRKTQGSTTLENETGKMVKLRQHLGFLFKLVFKTGGEAEDSQAGSGKTKRSKRG